MVALTDVPLMAQRKLTPFAFTRRVLMRNQAPIVSFTFDDFPDSAARTGATILDQHGAHGTFYAAGDLIGTHTDANLMASREQVEELHHRGHEIGCHTFRHIRLQRVSRATCCREVRDNLNWWRELADDRFLSSFAYPFGDASLLAKRRIGREYSSCRGTSPGVHARVADLAQLRAVSLYDSAIDEGGVVRWIDEAVRRNGWLIFYTHDVQPSPTKHGCSPDLLEFAVAAARRREVEVLPVRSAVGRLAFRAA